LKEEKREIENEGFSWEKINVCYDWRSTVRWEARQAVLEFSYLFHPNVHTTSSRNNPGLILKTGVAVSVFLAY
jgi:hypothetical protein